ncbi:MAG: DNA-processing protein DprA [Bacteroidales bacterium]|nr:DNA-processing protein DprA [Clostridium sp.]MCM1202714.1 DNA-processing protein DprA [Bacteroidales bacterium]
MLRKEDYWYWLNNIKGFGRVTLRKLIAEFKTPEAVYYAREKEICPLLGEKQAAAFWASRDEEQILAGRRRLLAKGIRFIHPDSPDYPARLRVIPDAPLGLYLKGTFPPPAAAVAVIGARNCTRYGKEMARFFGRELSRCGISVISGLARGIDGMAHAGALEAKGYTMGVLGCGIDRIYPEENYRLFADMERTGGILSESSLGVAPVPGLFPLRNRLIAGLSDGILVVEATAKSGTFITVDQGLEQGKEIFALPGRVTDEQSAGCNHLIKLGAHTVTEVSDILEILHIERKNIPKLNDLESVRQKTAKMSLAPLEKMVYSCLRIEPKYLDEIISEAKTAPQEVCMALNRLVLAGVVEEPVRNYYAIRL